MTLKAKSPLLENGTILNNKWEILEHLATGGKGEVYRAQQTNLDREVVVKTVSMEYLAEFEDDEQEIETEIQRFHREGLAMAQVRHPYVVQVYDQDSAVIVKDGTELTVQYVVMEYVPGPTLRSTMPEEGFGTNERAAHDWLRTYFLPVLDGIEAIHSLGIVHRDIKPENVLLDGSTPKITDFGIAGGLRWQHLTRSQHVEGTLPYMAPEQFMDLGETDARGDVYALGKILYESICGKMIDTRTACPLKGVCLPDPQSPFLKDLSLIIQQATAEDKDQRTSSVEALQKALEELLKKIEEAEHPVIRGLRRRHVTVLLAVIAVAAGLIIISNLVHHFIMIHEESMPSHPSVSEQPGPSVGKSETEKPAPETAILGNDGSTMRFVPGGEVSIPGASGGGAGEVVAVAPFYMTETEITNSQFVDFLNQALPRIMVRGGAVYGDDRIWLILGEVFGGYEPIIYQDGRFSLKDPSYASYPVVRVTGYGATAYAGFYGRRLPTELEWILAIKEGGEESKPRKAAPSGPSRPTTPLEQEMKAWVEAYGSSEEAPSDSSVLSEASQVPHPVSSYRRDKNGIRGLGSNVSEWGVRTKASDRAGSKPEYVVLGGLRGSALRGATLIPGSPQDPSAAFEDVGFRCVVRVKEK